MNVDDLQVTEAVVHYVPTTSGESLLLTDQAIALDAQLRAYFRDKIVASLKTRGLDAVVDPSEEQHVPEAVALIIDDPARLVAASQSIAKHLDAVQSGRNSSGLVVVVKGTLGRVPSVGIVKLERERGVRFVLDEVDGRRVVDLELLRNLTLTDKTKVFKTALLTCPAGASAAAVTGRVSDDQRGRAEGLPVANFFLATFLGCQPKVKAAKATFDFVKAANTSFNEDVVSPEKRGRYQVALVAAMQSQTAEIRPRSFASENLDPVDRAPFLAQVQKAGIDPNSAFPKDLSLVKVERFKLTFNSGMVLVGDVADLQEKVDLPEGAPSGQPVQVRDQVNQLLTAADAGLACLYEHDRFHPTRQGIPDAQPHLWGGVVCGRRRDDGAWSAVDKALSRSVPLPRG
ncbi:MAG TPA: nucleoid-associated protein [Solirubrobacteraceae bacterium]|nr:nucleoid-associated protein [Solirubrobacteraceae bacterium]